MPGALSRRTGVVSFHKKPNLTNSTLMGKTYEKAPAAVAKVGERVLKEYHSDLHKIGITIDYVFANNEGTAPAVSHGGYPALAVCRILGLKDRALGRSDAEITIDQSAWDGMSDEEQVALLDHEITHLSLVRDAKSDEIKFDDMSRPRLKIKKHDWHVGWFEAVARRHGKNSPEVYQAKLMWDRAGNAFWPELLGTSGLPPADGNGDAAPAEPAASVSPAKAKKAQVKERKAKTEIESKLNKALKAAGVTATVTVRRGKAPKSAGTPPDVA